MTEFPVALAERLIGVLTEVNAWLEAQKPDQPDQPLPSIAIKARKATVKET